MQRGAAVGITPGRPAPGTLHVRGAAARGHRVHAAEAEARVQRARAHAGGVEVALCVAPCLAQGRRTASGARVGQRRWQGGSLRGCARRAALPRQRHKAGQVRAADPALAGVPGGARRAAHCAVAAAHHQRRALRGTPGMQRPRRPGKQPGSHCDRGQAYAAHAVPDGWLNTSARSCHSRAWHVLLEAPFSC